MVAFERLGAALGVALAGEVRFDAAARAAYASDASNYRQVPVGVVLPRSVEDVVAAVALCREHGAAILPRGAGTSMCGQSVNAALVIDCSKYLDRVLEVDAERRTARVEPGAVCDALREAAEAHGLTFAPDPATHSRCTLGGMIGNNSCGPHSVMATALDAARRCSAEFTGWHPGAGRGEFRLSMDSLTDLARDLAAAELPK